MDRDFITVAPVVGALADRFGERPLMAAGLALQAVGLAWMALIAEPGIAYAQLLAPFIVGGVGVSMAIPAAQNSVLGSVAEDALGKAAGANSMMRELGGVFGIAVVVAVFAGAGSYASAAGVHRRLRARRSAPPPCSRRSARWPASRCPAGARRRVPDPAPVPAFEGEG